MEKTVILPDEYDMLKALPMDDRKAMNYYINGIALAMFRNFDTENRPQD